MLRKSPPAPANAGSKKAELKLIKCCHVLHDHADIWSGIDVGDGRAVALCKRCEEGIVARTLSALWKEALKEYMEKHLPAVLVAPPVPEGSRAENLSAEPGSESGPTIKS